MLHLCQFFAFPKILYLCGTFPKTNNDYLQSNRVMKKQFYIAPLSEIVEIVQESGLCITLSQARFIGFLEDGGDL